MNNLRGIAPSEPNNATKSSRTGHLYQMKKMSLRQAEVYRDLRNWRVQVSVECTLSQIRIQKRPAPLFLTTNTVGVLHCSRELGVGGVGGDSPLFARGRRYTIKTAFDFPFWWENCRTPTSSGSKSNKHQEMSKHTPSLRIQIGHRFRPQRRTVQDAPRS